MRATIKELFLLTASLSAMVGHADSGDSSPFLLDTAEGIRIAAEGEAIPIAYSPRWGNATSCTIDLGGSRSVATSEGTTTWTPSGTGAHTLTHTAGDLAYTAQFTVLGDDVETHGGTIARNEVWGTNKVHLVTAPVVFGDSDYDFSNYYGIEIQPGTIVKFMPGTGMSVMSNAWCVASGAIFTHVNDDTIGGDTLMDGDTTVPVMDDYEVSNMLTWDDTIEFRYRTDPNVTLSGTISQDETWRGHNVYCVTGNLTVASGATLTIMPGVIVKFAEGKSLTVNSGATLTLQSGTILKFGTGCSLVVNGTLTALGTRAAPIFFTSIKDDEHGGDTNGDGDKTYPWAGDWGCVLISGGNIMASYCRFTYGSGVDGNQYGARACLFMWNGGSGTFDGCWFGGSTMDGCFAQNAIFRNCIFTDCDRGLVSHAGTITAINCVAAFNRIGFFSHTSPLVVRNSISSLNLESAITGDGGSRRTYNCYFGNDPKFLDPENGDFRIAENSPCINAGDAANAPEFDYYGQPRNGAPDIGIYEVLGDTGTGYDLAATAVNAQAARSTIGDTIEVSYDVANVGRLAVADPWHDAL